MPLGRLADALRAVRARRGAGSQVDADSSPIRLSLHAAISAARRGIAEADIARARNEGTRFIQRDGAIIHLLEIEPGRYFYVVENADLDLIVTVSDRRVRHHEIERLTKRFGWERM